MAGNDFDSIQIICAVRLSKEVTSSNKCDSSSGLHPNTSLARALPAWMERWIAGWLKSRVSSREAAGSMILHSKYLSGLPLVGLCRITPCDSASLTSALMRMKLSMSLRKISFRGMSRVRNPICATFGGGTGRRDSFSGLKLMITILVIVGVPLIQTISGN
jgi:hypothetical protein